MIKGILLKKNIMKHPHEYWMQKSIEHARLGQTPFGAVIVKSDYVFITAYNTTSIDGPQAHAELNVISRIGELAPYEAHELRLYTTVEPCPMCMTALVWAGIGHLIYGATIDDAAAFGNQIHITSREIASKAWYSIDIIPEVERKACQELFKS